MVTNVITNVLQQNIEFTKENISKMKCVPRPPPKAKVNRERLKTPWDFFKSVFKGKL
jgi:hypothetical protein